MQRNTVKRAIKITIALEGEKERIIRFYYMREANTPNPIEELVKTIKERVIEIIDEEKDEIIISTTTRREIVDKSELY